MSEINTTIYLKDAQGQVLQKHKIAKGTQLGFDIEKLKNGVYFVELQLPDGKSIIHQFQINH
jgi:hypothetical protein